MRIWVYVEGPSDRLGLEALWRVWQQALSGQGKGLRIVDLQNKVNFLKVFGQRAARALAENNEDIVVALPDLYPNKPFADTDSAHADVQQLRQVLIRRVRQALLETQNESEQKADRALERLHSSAMKHDFEMLLLGAVDQLRSFLKTDDALGKWRHPVEDQDQDKPPKYVIGELVTKYLKRRDRDTVDAPAVLREVAELGGILRSKHGQIQCPVFKEALDWIGQKTGVPAYSFA